VPVATNPEKVRSITIRGGRSTKDPPYPKGARRLAVVPPVVEEENNISGQVLLDPLQDQERRQDVQDTNYLPFPHRNRRSQQSDEQFGKFVEVIQKLYVNIPLVDDIQVPTYAKYIRDILNKKSAVRPSSIDY
jgi:hypothetical protein